MINLLDFPHGKLVCY